MLSLGYFTMAGISHILARDALAAARLASEKTREAADLARINAKVIQDLPNGVLVIGKNGRLWNYNQQAERLLDCPLSSLAELMACNGDLAKVWRNWLNATGPDAAVLPLAESGRRLRCRLLELAPDREAGAVMILEDMSELEYEANQMKLAALGRLTANLAHEIRNPLSAINQAAQLLGEDSGQDAGMRKLTRIIEDNVSRLNYLVEDVLSLSRRDRMNREAIKLGDFLDNFVSQFEQSEAVEPGVIRLETGDDVVIGFDRMHLNQILWNLFRNALRHCSRQSGSIFLRVERAGEAVYIELWNDGPTIPAEMRQRLFEPFFSTDKTGTGLGLHIALELAEANEGLLRCLEQVQGARFRLTARIAT
jgi:two-component system sensor histidine kinase PilS (NtrC family)